VALAALSVASATGSVHAEAVATTIVVESYAGTRPANAEKIMGPLRAALQEQGYVADPTALAMRLDASTARPGLVDESLTTNELAQMFENGIRVWNSGDEEGALRKLEVAIATALRNPSLLSRVERLREQLFQGYLILAMAQRRRGLGPASEVSMGELIRTFPDRTIDVDEAGPEATDLYRFVVADLSRSKRGMLSIRVSDPAAVVFVNEVLRQDPLGNVVLKELLPGTYRVLVRSLDISERVRVYNVPVYPAKVTTLAVDWDLDSMLVMDDWVGLKFATTNEQAGERELAVKLGAAAKAAMVVTLNLSRTRGAYRVVAKRYETMSGAQLEWCQVDLSGPDRRMFKLLADCVKGEDNRARVKLDPPGAEQGMPRFSGALRVEPIEPPAVVVQQAPEPARTVRRRPAGMGKWLWVTGSVVSFAAGGLLLYLDGKASCRGPSSECPTAYDTRTAGLAFVGVGTVSLGVSAYFFLTEDPIEPGAVGARTSRKPWVAGVSLRW
jgi:hypothetical protein